MILSNYLKLLGVVFGVFFASVGVHAGVIKAGDILEITLKGVPVAEQAKVYSKLEVRQSGVIRIPMVNVDVRALGRTPEDVERSIEAAFKKAQIYVAPTISIQVHEKAAGVQEVKKMLSVGGHVRRNGRVLYREGMTLLEAIQQAGGRDTFGSKYIYLTRKDGQSGKLLRHRYNIKEPAAQGLKVYPDDLIEVPQRGAFEGN